MGRGARALSRKAPAAVLLLTLALISCGTEPRQAAGRQRLTIAAIGDFSGDGASRSQGIVRGIRVALGEYNSHRDSSYEAILRIEDTEGTPEGAAEAARRLTELELLIGVIGPFNADEVHAAARVLDDAGLQFLVPSVTSITVKGTDWHSFRRLVADDWKEGGGLAGIVAERTRKGPTALFHDGSADGFAFADGAASALAAMDVPILVVEATDASRLTSVADRLAKRAPAAVYFGGDAALAGPLAKVLDERGFRGRLAVSHHARTRAFFQAAQGVSGTLSACVCADPADPALREFVELHEDRFGSSPSVFAVEAYEGTLMLLESAEEVGTRPADIVSFLKGATEFRGDSKRYFYDPSGELTSTPVTLYELGGGRWVFKERAGD